MREGAFYMWVSCMMDLKRARLHIPELLALCMLVVGYCVISYFHEPWFDEAQAWQIAKCASVRDILFEIPHYEGHPPLWYLILLIPTKLGVPFEVGLKSIGCLVVTASAILILFISPFPRPVRLLLPFTYFLFYQYGIIVRPYCLMLLTFLLLAWRYPKRHTHPWSFVFLLMLLCLTSVYGMLFAAGIALCMSWELAQEKGFGGLAKNIFRDACTRALLALLVLAVLLVLEVFPRPDTMVMSAGGKNPFIVSLSCALFTFFGECTLYTSSWFSKDRVLSQKVSVPWHELAVLSLLGLLIWTLLISLSSKKNLKYLVLPYVLFSLVAASLYFSVHHVGIVLLFLLFWLWIAIEDEQRFEIGRAMLKRMGATERDAYLAKAVAYVAVACGLVIPLYWTVRASLNDLRLDYSYGRSTSQFFNEHGLTDSKIFGGLDARAFKCNTPEAQNGDYVNTNDVGTPVVTCAYLSKNLCYNLNGGNDAEAYLHFRYPTYEESQQAIKSWREMGQPDVMFGYASDNSKTLGNIYSEDDYALVYVFELNSIWKDSYHHADFPIFVRRDLLDTHGLQELGGEETLGFKGFKITDEMRAQYEAGVPIEDIIAQYIDKESGEPGT